MIVLDNISEVGVDSSSKGNQRKFYKWVWIKLDSQNCYEGLVEDFVSKFCACIFDFPHVQYESSKFEYNDNEYNGASLGTCITDRTSYLSASEVYLNNGVLHKIFSLMKNQLH